jgi:hypothetical protein
MADFRTSCERYSIFRCLRTLTLTVHQQVPINEWTKHVTAILSPSDTVSVPLESFQIYSSGAFFESSRVTDQFWFDLVQTHKDRLKRISVHRMLISMAAIEDICRKCVELEELFVVVEPGTLVCLLQNVFSSRFPNFLVQ